MVANPIKPQVLRLRYPFDKLRARMTDLCGEFQG